MENGLYTLRLYVTSPIGTIAERRIVLSIDIPTKQDAETILVPVYGTEESIPDFFENYP
jgi:hypothetical protein